MSSPLPIDLVQDAATDCSVVASLCAGVARSERGYDKVRQPRNLYLSIANKRRSFLTKYFLSTVNWGCQLYHRMASTLFD